MMPDLSVTCDNICAQIVSCDIILFRVHSYQSMKGQELVTRMESISELFDARIDN